VVESQAGPTVFVVDEQGKVKVVPVRASFTYEGLRVLESGLEPGQAVIVEGLQLVRSGMTVKPRTVSAESLAGPARPTSDATPPNASGGVAADSPERPGAKPAAPDRAGP
jgi:membrane fusion protein (multidrug efflux system)